MLLYGVIVFLFLLLLFFCVIQESDFAGANGKPEIGADLTNEEQRKRGVRLLFRAVFLVSIGFLWFLTAFRSTSVGNDTATYVRAYRLYASTGKINPNSQFEIGYQIYNILLGKICGDENFILIVTATLCYVGVGVYILKYSKNPFFSLILFFCLCFSAYTNILRQCLAMVIVLYAYQAIKNKKYPLAVILIALAATFHTTALGALLFLFHRLYSYKLRTVFVTAGITIALSMSGLISGVLAFILTAYSRLFESEYASSGWLGIFSSLIIAVTFYLIAYFAYRDKMKENSLALANFLILLLYTCLGFSMNLFARASDYFLLIGAIELPNALYEIKTNKPDKPNQTIRWVFLIGALLLAYFMVVIIFRPEWNRLYPYTFYWNS